MTNDAPSAARLLPRLRAGAMIATSIILAVMALPANAQDTGRDCWQYAFTPYIWASGMDGTVRINNKLQAGATVQQSFSDIIKILDFALMGAFEARKDRWGVLVDGMYFKVSDEGSVKGPLGFSSLSASAAITQQVYSLAGSYRAIEGRSPVDLFGGLRYNSVKWDVDIAASVPVVLVPARRFVETKHWVDPYIGVRAQYPLDDRWSLGGYADIGGFGAGSELALQAIASATYAFRPDIRGKVGYRYVSVDYRKNDFKYDMANAGFFSRGCVPLVMATTINKAEVNHDDSFFRINDQRDLLHRADLAPVGAVGAACVRADASSARTGHCFQG